MEVKWEDAMVNASKVLHPAQDEGVSQFSNEEVGGVLRGVSLEMFVELREVNDSLYPRQLELAFE